MFILGIESTAHTFSIGVINKNKRILANEKSVYKPKKGYGINPREASIHHKKVANKVLKNALKTAGIKINEIYAVAYSSGPGLPPCLKVGVEMVKKLKKPIYPVNHCIAHIEIGKLLTHAKDPITLYVSGGNTQVIGFVESKYRCFGETIDKPIGSAIDTFIRKTIGEFPGGPVMEKLAKKGERYVKMPYTVKGMDVSFSGIITHALRLYYSGIDIHDICFSFQETCYAMLTEIVERALAHTGKDEVLLTGGVASSERLREILGMMCKERGAKFFVVPKKYAGDNGAMIALVGVLKYNSNVLPSDFKNADFKQKYRVDDVIIDYK